MTKMTRGLWLTAAASIAFAMGCGGGGGEPTDAGNTCSSDAACGTGKVCHPALKTCVQSCTLAADCSGSQRKCARYDGTPGTSASPGFCQCETDQLCSSVTANQVCNLATKQCTDKCTSNLSCPTGSTCTMSTGVCTALSGTDAGTGDAGTSTDAGTDAGMDAGVLGCDPMTQPGSCGYGSYCSGVATCETVSVGTCSNVAALPAWSTSSTGPVIYYVEDNADVIADCTLPDGGITGNPFTTTVYAYTKTGTFPANKSNLPGFFYYSSSGTPTDIPLNLLRTSGYSLFQGGSVMTAKFTLCSSATQSIQAGFAFTGGNPVCATLTR